MTRWLVLGATGGVGSVLTSLLAERPDTSVAAVSRNRVLLEELNRRLGCETLQFDVTSSAARLGELPAADVVVDLTYAGGRHPRAIVRKAENAVALIGAYLDRHRAARLVHTGTWVLLQRRPSYSDRLVTRLDWSSTYTLSKSAAERALAREWWAGRMRVIRLGNVVTPDSIWGVALLRALRASKIESAETLISPANVCGVDALVEAVDDPGGEPVALGSSAAGWTWGEILEAAARAVVRRGGEICGEWEPVGRAAAGAARSRTTVIHSLPLRGLWPMPLLLDTVALDSIPGWLQVAPVLKRMLGAHEASPLDRLPPGLPASDVMPGAGRDEAALQALADVIAEAYLERGYTPLVQQAGGV